MASKRIVSISLGSSSRNHRVVLKIGNDEFIIERIGTDGDFNKACQLIRELDGKVDAFGMGGISMYLYGKNNHRYILRSAVPLRKAARLTPMADGSGFKSTVEHKVVRFIKEELGISIEEKTVLLVSGMERLGMAEAFSQAGCKTLYGDLLFVLGIPYAIKKLSSLHRLAAILMPVIQWMPLKVLYPSGMSQEENTPRFRKAFEKADIIAGDFMYIKKYMPLSLKGKIIVTNTVTPKDVEILRDRGAELLITSTPELEGRSYGTNVMEALVCALVNKKPEDILPHEYDQVLKQGILRHRVEYLQALRNISDNKAPGI
ncbi:MAG: quinate 5-dehydrogenase [Clostridiales bacterium]|nr:quinate 5-dehydrogenase [Clostridiales bacterium]